MDSYTYFKNMTGPDDFAKLEKPRDVPHLLTMAEERFGDRLAMAEGDVELRYAEFAGEVASMRGAIASLGLPKGANIGILMGNGINFMRTFFAITTCGHAAVLFPAATRPEVLIGGIGKYDVTALVYEPATAATVEGIRDSADIPFLTADTKGDPIPMVSVQPEDAAVIIFTGGTTGRPKGAVLSHRALMRGTFNGAFAGLGRTFHQRYVQLIPLTHVFGLIRSFLTCVLTGSAIYPCSDMRQMFQLFAQAKPTILVMVPAMADMIFSIATRTGAGKTALGGGLTTIICGAAPVSPSLVEKFKTLDIRLLPGYGLTETANLVSGNGEAEEYPDSVGMPYPGQELKIVDGELWVKGDHVMTCYYNDEAETKAAMEDGWFKTGDLARFDEEGRLYIVGRKKNIIVLDNGENVSPEELEKLVNDLPFVKDSLVYEGKNDFGRLVLQLEVLPDPIMVKKLGIDDPEQAIRQGVDEINKKLPEWERMLRVTVRSEDFPRSPAMKILRPVQK
ncbi:MAG: AMP-binding protein [Christensenellales bacterium]|jgi:long-chain acyl-CoA synthetase